MAETRAASLGEARTDPDARAFDSLDVADRLAVEGARRRLFGEPYDPIRIGRFVLLREIGRGGMGVVHAGYDEMLDRRVALKLIARRHRDTPEARARLVREARALARVTDTNVVNIYEAGEHEGDVFVAMEFVEGPTLRQWLDEPRPIGDVVRIFLGAGAGLAAAHRVGIVHRDFKPDNVLLAGGTIPKVADFGLAGMQERVEPTFERGSLEPDSTITRTGAVLGTPAYMAPEQWSGGDCDARADQFAFCVALYEALHRESPFAGDDESTLMRAVTRGELSTRRGGVPDWLQRIVVRGLSVDPEARWRDMDELLGALARDPSERRRGLVAVAAVAVLGIGAWGWVRFDRERAIAGCEREGAAILDEWGEQPRRVVRESMLATGVPHAAATADRILPWLDAYAQSWREHRTNACLQVEVEQAWSADTLDRARWCLDERRVEFVALVERLARASALDVHGAAQSTVALPDAAPCMDAALLASRPAPPAAADRETVAAARAEVASLAGLLYVDEESEGLAAVRAAREHAELVWPPLAAKATLLEAQLLMRSDSNDAAEVACVGAYMTAAKAGDWDVAAEAAELMAIVIGRLPARLGETRVWVEHAEIAALLAGDPQGLHAAGREHALGLALYDAGEYVEAKALLEGAVARREAALGENNPQVEVGLRQLAKVEFALGDGARSLAYFERVVRAREALLGPEHPQFAGDLGNLGQVHLKMGNIAEARALTERAQALRERTLPPDHPKLAAGMDQLASLYSTLGEPERARPLRERSVAIRERVFGSESREVAISLQGLGEDCGLLDDHAQAMAHFQRALAIVQKVAGPDHPDVASAREYLVWEHVRVDEYVEAEREAALVLAQRERLFGPEHIWLVDPLAHIGASRVETRRFRDAIEPLERALALVDAQEGVHTREAYIRYYLARALAELGQRDRALALARQAIADCRGRVDIASEECETVGRWLAERGG